MTSQPTLVDNLTARLAEEIRANGQSPGARLPPASALERRFGVSRTVVREALARLRAEGLIRTRQGSGAFVTALADRPLRLDSHDPARVLDILELRLGLETEAAALAAQRATVAQKTTIVLASEALEACANGGGDGVEEDLRFHVAIAEASGNPLFPQFVAFLVEHYRACILSIRPEGAERAALLRRVAREHGAVADAIRHGDAEEARWAIRRHLRDGQLRVLARLTANPA